jgi:RNA polymerase sigma factor (sigma-70 family)
VTSAEFRKHLPLVEFVARRVHSKYGHVRPGPEFDDLVSFGSKGLIEAAGRFDPGRRVSFQTFAYRRIHGAMLDGLRKMGPYSRRDVEHHREAPDSSFTFVEFDESVPANTRTDDLGDQVDRRATVQAALRLLDRMPEAKRSLVRSYFFEGLQLHEIGARRGQSKSWMCRMLAQALGELREELTLAFPELGTERGAA